VNWKKNKYQFFELGVCGRQFVYLERWEATIQLGDADLSSAAAEIVSFQSVPVSRHERLTLGAEPQMA
jgi:hypothetical protein